MQCATCNTEISSAFRHAIARNECPACGGSIMDEETLALIEHIQTTISNEVMLKEEAVQKITLALLAQYNITLSGSEQAIRITKREVSSKAEATKVAPPSSMQKVEAKNIIKAEDVITENISQEERDRIMEEVVREKYKMVDQIQASGISANVGELPQVGTQDSPFTEGNTNPILEEERLMRLKKQEQAIQGGGPGAFRRSG